MDERHGNRQVCVGLFDVLTDDSDADFLLGDAKLGKSFADFAPLGEVGFGQREVEFSANYSAEPLFFE